MRYYPLAAVPKYPCIPTGYLAWSLGLSSVLIRSKQVPLTLRTIDRRNKNSRKENYMIKIDGLTTENVNEATKHIDQMDSLGIVTLINEEDKKVASAVEAGIFGYEMYTHGQEFVGGDGIVTEGVEATLKNVGRLGKQGMKETNEEIIRIMIGENC